MSTSTVETVFDPYADMNRRTLESLRAMSQDEYMAFLRKIGIYDEHGNLTPRYGGEPENGNGSHGSSPDSKTAR